MAFRMSSGLWTLPPACPTKRTMALPAGAALHFAHHLAKIQFRHDDALYLCGDVRESAFPGTATR